MGPDLMINFRKQTERMGTTIVDDEVTKVDFKNKPFKVSTASKEYEANAVIICTGANPRKLGLEGETTFAGKGVSYCATCDGPFFRNQELVVAGGGDSAVEEATFLTKFATTVHLVHRRDELRASKVMQERAMADKKIKFHWNKNVDEIIGNGKVQKIILKDTKTDEKSTLEAGGIFVAIGHEPNTKLFVGHVELDKQGYVILKENTKTNVEGVFAAGYGCMAAIDVDKYLSEK